MAFSTVYTVNAWIVDANGTFNFLSGYPKAFQSKNYNNDNAKAQQRALAEFHSTVGTLCLRDDRKLQTVTIHDAYGHEIEAPFSIGSLEIPEPEPEPEPEEPTPE